MSDGFTIGAANAASTLFECPGCKETIDSLSGACRFCGLKVDHQAAVAASQLMSKISQACSDASYMRSCAWTLGVFFVLRLVPIISMVGTVGFFGLLVGIPIWAMIWWFRYGNIKTTDADYLKARKAVVLCGVIVSILFVVFASLPFLLAALRASQH